MKTKYKGLRYFEKNSKRMNGINIQNNNNNKKVKQARMKECLK